MTKWIKLGMAGDRAARTATAGKTKKAPGQQRTETPTKGQDGEPAPPSDTDNMDPVNSLKIVHIHARNILNKLDHLNISVNEKEPDIILITESWCNDSISNGMLNIPGYCIEPDTLNARGGGLLVFGESRDSQLAEVRLHPG